MTTGIERTTLPVADSTAVVAEVRRALAGQGPRAAVVVVTMIVGAALGLVAPWALGLMVDAVVGGNADGRIWVLGLVMVSAALGFSAFSALGVVLSARLFETVLARLREKMFTSSLALPLERVEEAGSGDLVSRATDDVEEVSNAITNVVPALSTSLFTVLLTAVGLTALDWRFLIALLVIVPIYVFAVRWYLRNAPAIYAAERAAMGVRAQHVLGSVNGLRTVHAYGLAPTLARRVGAHSWEVVRWTMRARIVQNRFYGRLNTAQYIGMASLLIIGFYLVGADALTVGATTTAMLFFLRLFEPIEDVLLVIDELQSALASLARIVGVIQVDGTDADRKADLPDHGVLEARGVAFGYRKDRTIVRDMNIRIDRGEKVAVVGASGSGKTTLAALLAGVRTPATGTVTFGSVDIAGASDIERAKRITLITQDVHVFAGPLRADLALADPQADDATMFEALNIVFAREWVDLLPDGLDTVVGAGGHRLTSLQAQQLALARLVLADPPVAILDEATADAGSAGAGILERGADAALSGRSAVIVAHRLDQARRADRILLMHDGSVVEEGSHDDLIRQRGRYSALWEAWSTHR